MKTLNDQYANFIILCKDIETLRDMKKALDQEANEPLIRDRQVVVFDQFERNHSATGALLRSLKQKDFIVLTLKEGGIAIDYQGTSVAHPIITYGTKNSS